MKYEVIHLQIQRKTNLSERNNFESLHLTLDSSSGKDENIEQHETIEIIKTHALAYISIRLLIHLLLGIGKLAKWRINVNVKLIYETSFCLATY